MSLLFEFSLRMFGVHPSHSLRASSLPVFGIHIEDGMGTEKVLVGSHTSLIKVKSDIGAASKPTQRLQRVSLVPN